MGILPRLYCKPRQTNHQAPENEHQAEKSNRPRNKPRTVNRYGKTEPPEESPRTVNVKYTLRILRKLMRIT